MSAIVIYAKAGKIVYIYIAEKKIKYKKENR